MQSGHIHPTIVDMFYNLPLDRPRLELREAIVHDKRFILTDTTFNGFTPSSFFKGITADKGLMSSSPDSIQVMLVYGNALLVTVKGGQPDPDKHPMILEVKYFYSNKDIVEKEYARMLEMIRPVFTDTTSIVNDEWETDYSRGIQKCVGKIFDTYDPYYRVAISSISFVPTDGSKSAYVLAIGFSKEDK